MTERDPSKELEQIAEEAGAAYEQNEALRALVVAIPGVGSSLDIALASSGQRQRDRIISFVSDMQEDMQQRLEDVEDTAVDQEYLKSDEFFDLLLKAFDTAAKTRDEEKRRVCARVLVESTILFKREGYSPEEYLDLIAQLTPKELAVARALYRDWAKEEQENRETSAVGGDWRAWQDKACTELSIDGADLQLILGRLESSGLITEDTALFPSDGGPRNYTPRYWSSPAFKKLMQFLERRE